MNSKQSITVSHPSACPRCGSGTKNAFGFEGLCLRCAGLRVLEAETETPWTEVAEDRPLDRIGPYEIIEELGHGGMGRVFATRQPGLGRIIAVKALREGVDPELDLRFMREMQTIARLRHPNIVSVHESGRADGNLYFSMDYIEGGDLAARLRVETIPAREAAYLMSRVAEALAYSHDQGILHRDLKPSNILLDGKEPKLADFGLASQIGPGGDLTAVTRVLGTPHYIAPEALSDGSAALSVASDVYSAGIILFEMLTGRTPFAGASVMELPALIRDAEPPPVRMLAPGVPRDLETICLKCLEKDPLRRYSSASALAEDLRRFLDGRPIVARPAGTWHRLAQLCRRHRLAVGASAFVALTLIGATALSLWFAARARKAEHEAAAESQISKAVVAFLENDLLIQAAPDAQPDRDIKLRTVLDRAADKISKSMAGQPMPERSLRQALAQTYESLGEYPKAIEQLQKAVELDGRLDGPQARATLTDEGELAVMQARTGRFDEALKAMTALIPIEEKVLGPDDPQVIHAGNDLIFILSQTGNIQKAETVAREVAAHAERVLGPDASDTLDAEADLSSMYFWEGRYAEAEPLNRRVIAGYKALYGPDNARTLTAMGNLAAVYASEDRMREAQEMDEQIYNVRKRILGPDHPDTLRVLNNWGSVLRQGGEFRRATEINRLSYEGRLKLYGPSNSETLMSQANLAWALLESGDRAGARQLAVQGLDAARKALGPDHHATLGMERIAGEVERRDGRLAEAEILFRHTYDSRVSHGGAKSYNTLAALLPLTAVMIQRGEAVEAESLLRPAIAAWQETRADDWRRLLCENLMGGALAAQGRHKEALDFLMPSAEGLAGRIADIPAAEHHQVSESMLRVAQSQRALGNEAAALAWEKRAASVPQPAPGA
jgi:eukaryotic-like serine/threonine-protein kinase